MMEVFVRLPNCKSAIQCALVSKHWYSLVSDPHFICSFLVHHRQQNPFTILIGLYNYSFPCIIYSIFSDNILGRPPSLSPSNYFNFLPKDVPNDDPWVVRASCDDLLLVSYAPTDELYICNPLTNKYVALPNPDLDLDLLFNCKYGLVVRTNHYNYKVVLIGKSKAKDPYTLIAAIYCSKTLKWCTYMVKSPQKLHYYAEKLYNADVVVACNNGMLHWMDVRLNLYVGIFVFDPFQEPKHCIYINLPARVCFLSLRNEIFMGVCQGRLRLSYLDRTMDEELRLSYCLHVWELRNYDNDVDSWCLKHKVRFEIDSYSIPYVLAFNPSNAHIVFLLHMDRIYECTLTNFRMEKQVGKLPYELRHRLKLLKYQSLPLVHPAWPTPVSEHRHSF